MLKFKRPLIILLFVFLLLFAGCSIVKKIIPGAAGPGVAVTFQAAQEPITSPAVFQADYKQWTRQLEGITERINSAYADWNANKINKTEFLDQLKQVQNDLNSLNQVTDLQTVFNLSGRDQQRVNYQTVYKTYLYVSKDVNDFLYYAPHLTDDQIKAKYAELIQNKYNSDLTYLKNLEAGW